MKFRLEPDRVMPLDQDIDPKNRMCGKLDKIYTLAKLLKSLNPGPES